jgi:hypothetical protein
VVILIDHPVWIEVEKNSHPSMDLEKVKSKLETWANNASKIYGIEHAAKVETDIEVARSILKNTEGLMYEQIRPFCADNETVTIYYTGKKASGRINILGLWGYTLLEYRGNY